MKRRKGEKLEITVGGDVNKFGSRSFALEDICPSVSFYNPLLLDRVSSWPRPNFRRRRGSDEFGVHVERIILHVLRLPRRLGIVIAGSRILWILVAQRYVFQHRPYPRCLQKSVNKILSDSVFRLSLAKRGLEIRKKEFLTID